MKEYDVKITETLEKTVTVQAASQAEAEEKVEEAGTIQSMCWTVRILLELSLQRKAKERWKTV